MATITGRKLKGFLPILCPFCPQIFEIDFKEFLDLSEAQDDDDAEGGLSLQIEVECPSCGRTHIYKSQLNALDAFAKARFVRDD